MTTSARAALRGPATVLWVVPGVYLLFVASEFLALTHLALTLTNRGASATSVGLLVSMLWIGIFLMGTRAHLLVARWGYRGAFICATASASACVAALAASDSYWAWCAGAFALGLAGGLVWIAGESWLAEAAPAANRGFYVGLFETSVGVGMMLGPALLALATAKGWPPLVLALALMLGTTLLTGVLAFAREPQPPSVEGKGGAAGAASAPNWRSMALPLAAVAAVAGLMESGASSLLPSISMRVGLDITAAALLGTVIGAGSALLQAPFGVLADRAGMARAMALAWATLLAATLALLAQAEQPRQVLWLCGFLFGGVGGAVYTLVVIELGHRLRGAGLVKAMGLLVTAYTLGTVSGPLAGGWLFDRAGLPGMALALVLLCLAGCALAARALWRRTSDE